MDDLLNCQSLVVSFTEDLTTVFGYIEIPAILSVRSFLNIIIVNVFYFY